MRTARGAGSAICTGSLKNIMMPSPEKRSSVPSCASTSPPIAAWYSPSTAITSSGSAVSVKAVNPRRSRKTTVISRRWLFSGSSAPPATISSASCGEKKRFSLPTFSSWRDAVGHALLERAIQLGELALLAQHLVVQRLDAQQRAHPRQQLGLARPAC